MKWSMQKQYAVDAAIERLSRLDLPGWRNCLPGKDGPSTLVLLHECRDQNRWTYIDRAIGDLPELGRRGEIQDIVREYDVSLAAPDRGEVVLYGRWRVIKLPGDISVKRAPMVWINPKGKAYFHTWDGQKIKEVASPWQGRVNMAADEDIHRICRWLVDQDQGVSSD